MNKYKRMKTLLSGLLLITTTAGAQQLTISSNENPDCAVTLRSGSAIEYSGSSITVEVSDDPEQCLRQPGAGGEIGAVLLDVSPYSEVESGSSVTLTWVVPQDHTCTITRNNSSFLGDAAVDADNTRIDTVTANTSYRLECRLPKDGTTSAPGELVASATASVTVAGTDDGGGDGTETFCSGGTLTDYTRIKPVSFNKNRSASTGSTYADVWNEWSASSETIHMELKNLQYASLPFTVKPKGQRKDDVAAMVWDTIQANPDHVRLSVSTCVGPPTKEHAISPACFQQTGGSIGGFNMKTLPLTGNCEVAEGQQYYFNFAWISESDQPGCLVNGGKCFWNISER